MNIFTHIFHVLLVTTFLVAFVHVGETLGETKSRTFQLRYGAKLKDLQDFERIRVWLPAPTSDATQDVTMVENSLSPGSYRITRDETFDNSIVYLQVGPSREEFEFHIDYVVKRRELRAFDEGKDSNSAASFSAKERQLFLSPNKLVPTTGKPLSLLPDFGSNTSVLQRSRMLYDRVDAHVKYDKSKPGFGNGDVLWVFDSCHGNCTDFHSLFISLTRSQAIPSRFEIGFPLPPKRGSGTIGGYHCWASFFDEERGWIPVDISEADKHPDMKDYYFGNLTENRVAFSIGRDIHLEPRQAGPPLNYFIHPYVEADGKLLDGDHISFTYEYKDLKDTDG